MSRVIENPYENFIALSRYARWLSEENRRETWGETVDRYFDFILNHLGKNHGYTPDEKLVKELKVTKDSLDKVNIELKETKLKLPKKRSFLQKVLGTGKDSVEVIKTDTVQLK